MSSNEGRTASPDRGLDAVEGWAFMEALDAAKVAGARGAVDVFFRVEHGSPPRPSSWREALVALDDLGAALAAWEILHVDQDALELMIPHAALAWMPVLARDRSRWGVL